MHQHFYWSDHNFTGICPRVSAKFAAWERALKSWPDVKLTPQTNWLNTSTLQKLQLLFGTLIDIQSEYIEQTRFTLTGREEKCRTIKIPFCTTELRVSVAKWSICNIYVIRNKTTTNFKLIVVLSSAGSFYSQCMWATTVLTLVSQKTTNPGAHDGGS